MEEKINLADFSYNKDTKVEIPALALMPLLNLLNGVIQQETKMALSYEYPTVEGKEIKMVDHNLASFFNQPGVKVISELGASALEMQYVLEDIHAKNIESGVAIKNEEVGQFKL